MPPNTVTLAATRQFSENGVARPPIQAGGNSGRSIVQPLYDAECFAWKSRHNSWSIKHGGASGDSAVDCLFDRSK